MPNNEWLAHDGREVQSVIWSGENAGMLAAKPDLKLILRAEYMGDRTEVWVAAIRDGKEVGRHNARMIETIGWADEASSDIKGAHDG